MQSLKRTAIVGGLLVLFIFVPQIPVRAADAPVGWATVGAGTTGGQGGKEFQVTTAADLEEALKREAPKSIRIRGTLSLSADVRLTSNTTLEGDGPDAALTGGGLHPRKVRNVIIRNLTISRAGDAINIEESDHVWVDHCDLSNCRDGLLDIKRGSDYITVSWNHFHDHHKTCLLGHSDKDGIRALDRGHLRVTYHHNFFDGTETRHPRVRFAEGVHVFNNYYFKNSYGVASVMDVGVIVEGNVYEEVPHPTYVSYGDSPDPGRLVAENNLLIGSGEPETRGIVPRDAIVYKYTLDPVESLRDRVKRRAGVFVQVTPE